MPDEKKDEVQLEIGHVLFLDIVGYSKLMINEQAELLEHLKGMVRDSPQAQRAQAEGKLIRLATGDGIALVFLTSPEAPAQCALELSQADKEHPELRLRMGIHSGPINHVTDVNERANVTGAGINMAQRVMDCGDAGHILLSQHVADDLEQYPRWRPLLHDLGECEVKHGVKLRLVNLYTAELGNPALPEKVRQGQATKDNVIVPAPKKSGLPWPAVIVALLLLAAIAVFFFRQHSTPPTTTRAPTTTPAATPTPAVIPDKSIAVLPFENLSSDKENSYFADGVQDEILTDLAKIADLKVISRTSVMQYKSGVARNLREIGQQLGVAHLLEGSVQRAPNKVRINAQLIDARTDAHQWAQVYDRPLDDAFAIQSEIAKTIADQLQAKLSPNEKAAIEKPPTTDLAAFDLYTRAKTLLLTARFSASNQQSLQQAVELLDQAVARDPAFFEAYYQLVFAHGYAYSVQGDHTPARLALAQAALQAATRLRPDSGETHLARANYLLLLPARLQWRTGRAGSGAA